MVVNEGVKVDDGVKTHEGVRVDCFSTEDDVPFLSLNLGSRSFFKLEPGGYIV